MIIRNAPVLISLHIGNENNTTLIEEKKVTKKYAYMHLV